MDGWQAYNNEKYGIQLLHPENLKQEEKEYELGNDLTSLNYRLFLEDEIVFNLSTHDPSMKDHMRLYRDEESEKEILIDGEKGSQFMAGDMKDGSEYQQTIFIINNILYSFIGEGEIFNQILNTVKFIEE